MDYRNTYSWQMTVELAPRLVRLAEELPAAEEQGLTRHLLDIVVSLPAAVALDLSAEGSRRRECLMRLQAALAVLESVYPAIDAAETAEAVQALEARLLGNSFAEKVPPPAEPEPEEHEEPEPPALPDAQEPA